MQRVVAKKICDTLIKTLNGYQRVIPENPSEKFMYPRPVAEAVLAKFHFQKQAYVQAFDYVLSVIDCGQYALETLCDNIYTANSTEAILTFPNRENPGSHYRQYIQKGPYYPAVRLAEILLIAAESSLETGNLSQAVEKLNRLRQRNGRPTLASADDPTKIRSAIFEEWEKDLGCEGLLFAALKRSDLAESTLQIESFRKVFPIPYGEIMYNPYARQNSGC